MSRTFSKPLALTVLAATLVAGIGLAASLSGCGGGAPAKDGAAGGAAKADGPRDMLIYASGSDLQNMIPIVSQSASDSAVFQQVFLQGSESDFDCSLKFQPALYTSWAWAEDNLSVTLKLRDDITWPDGVHVTADDVVFAYELIGDTTVASPRYGFVDSFASPPEALSPTEVKFTFKEPRDRDTLLSQVTGYYLPKHLLADADRASLRTHPLSKLPPATGAFKLAEHKPNEYFVLEPNEKFTGPDDMKAHLKRVMFRIVPEYQTRLLKLKKGEVDMVDGIKVKDADELKKTNPNLRFERRGYRFMDYIAWNLKDPRFQDIAVRKAMAQGVDIDKMIGRLLTSESGEVYAKQAIGTITPEICSVRPDIEPIARDVEGAKKTLADAGWADTDGDGVLDKDGVKLEFTLITNKENERRLEAAALVQSDLKELGINVKLDRMEFNAMSDKLRSRDFEAVLGGWSAGLFVDPSAMWHSGDEYVFNYPSYNNPEVDALIDQALRTPDPAEAAPMWKEVQQRIYEDQPYLFLWWRDEVVAIDDRFEDTSIDILSLFHKLERWKVPADKVKYKF